MGPSDIETEPGREYSEKTQARKVPRRKSCVERAMFVLGVLAFFCVVSYSWINQPSFDYTNFPEEVITTQTPGPEKDVLALSSPAPFSAAITTPTPFQSFEPSLTPAPFPAHQFQATPIPTRAPEKYINILQSYFDKAETTRARRIITEPGISTWIDMELNKNRWTILLLGCGETYEPPKIIGVLICTPTMYSFVIVDKPEPRIIYQNINWNHDIQAPEVRKKIIETTRRDPGPKKIDLTHRYGGFNLDRTVFENASGLFVDDIAVINDRLIPAAIAKVHGNLNINLPWNLTTNPIIFQQTEYPGLLRKRGENTFSPIDALAFLKATEINADPIKEPNARKPLFVEAYKNALLGNPINLMRFIAFVTDLADKPQDYGIELEDKNLTRLFSQSAKQLGSIRPGYSIPLPEAGKSLIIGDTNFGAVGAIWVTADVGVNPIITRDVENGVYKDDISFTVPLGARVDPYSDNLVGNYWDSVRRKLAEEITVK